MKKILLSLAVIAAVSAIAIGATFAYFSDTESSVGNTFSAGTIDIAIDSQNPWTKNYSIGDLKPGETGHINFDIQNVGQNPVNITKNLSNIVGTGGVASFACAAQGGRMVSSEPECFAEGATANDNVQTQIIYDLSVEVFANNTSTEPIWWQTIYTDADGKSLSDVYGAGQYVALGMIPVGGHMKVTQSYHFNPLAGNEYQGDALSFDITIKADQMPQGENGMTSVVLENKVEGENHIWDIVQDSIFGTLNYKNQGPLFDFNFTGTVNTAGINYTLVYVGPSGNYPYVNSVILAQGTPTTNLITLSGSIDTGSITNGKIWLIPTTVYPTGWDQANTLFETALINYTKN